MNKKFLKKLLIISLSIGIIAALFYAGYYFFVRKALKDSPSSNSEKGNTGNGGNKELMNFSGEKDLPGISEAPDKPAILRNRKQKVKDLLKKKGNNDFELAGFKIKQGEEFGLFDPNKEVTDYPATTTWENEGKNYKLLRVERDDQYYYVPIDNVYIDNPNLPIIPPTGNQKGIYEKIAREVADLIDGPTPPWDAVSVRNRLAPLTNDELKAVAEAYKEYTGSPLIIDLKNELEGWRGTGIYNPIIEKLEKLGL